MIKNYFKVTFLSLIGVGTLVASCSSDDNNSNDESLNAKIAVVENYANIVAANYQKAYDDAVVLKTAINQFTATPTLASFNEAKDKWKLSRESYGTTEAFRFANGPIDDENGPEGLLNAWPLDENYIDYVEGGLPNGGIINNAIEFPTITKELLEGLNEEGGEKNISIGYHAIEFLLWGQDLTAPSAHLAGLRPFTDFVDGGSNANQARRRQYLNVCAELLVEHLDYLVDQWKVGGAYRGTFLALPVNDAIKNIYTGIATLAQAELAEERMNVALGNADQEDEHSCFSDNTHRDIATNLQGIINVYQGKYGTIDGPSLEDLVKTANLDSYNDTNASVVASQTKTAAILTPFDHAISGGLESAEGAKVRVAVLELKNLGANLIAGASKIGVNVNVVE